MGIRGIEPYGGVYGRQTDAEWDREPTEQDVSHLLEEALLLIDEGSTLYLQGMQRYEAVKVHYASIDRSVRPEVLSMVLEMVLLEATLANIEMRLGLVCSLVGSFLFEETVKYRHHRAAGRGKNQRR